MLRKDRLKMKEKKYYYIILKVNDQFLVDIKAHYFDHSVPVIVLIDKNNEQTDYIVNDYESKGYEAYRYPSDRLGHIVNRFLKKDRDIIMYTDKFQYFNLDGKLIRTRKFSKN